MPNPFDVFWEDRPAAPVTTKVVKKIKPKADHAEARQIYESYLIKSAYLKKQQAYAERVAQATNGPSKTPVMPLATMGTHGGPLLCDECLKPMILEGGKFHGAYVNKAWEKNPDPSWVSYIKGGMVVRIVDNGTLRIYHGYVALDGCCDTIAEEKRKRLEETFVRDRSKDDLLLAFLEEEFPTRVNELFNEILTVMFKDYLRFGVNKC